jgi:hypothetical protein
VLSETFECQRLDTGWMSDAIVFSDRNRVENMSQFTCERPCLEGWEWDGPWRQDMERGCEQVRRYRNTALTVRRAHCRRVARRMGGFSGAIGRISTSSSTLRGTVRRPSAK